MEKQRKFRTLNRSDRLQLEALYNNGTPVKEIANYLGFHISTTETGILYPYQL